MHYYQFNIGDYTTHTLHLDDLEDLAYRRMLDWYYLHESPLPDSVDQIAKFIRMRTHTESIANVLHEFFTLTEYGYQQKKVDEQERELKMLKGGQGKSTQMMDNLCKERDKFRNISQELQEEVEKAKKEYENL